MAHGVDAVKRVVYNNFFLSARQCTPVHLAFNTVQLLQCKIPNFLSPEIWPRNRPELISTDYKI